MAALVVQIKKGGQGVDSGNGGNPWLYGSLQAPSWELHGYDELNSTGPLLPLLQQYLDAGTVFFVEEK